MLPGALSLLGTADRGLCGPGTTSSPGFRDIHVNPLGLPEMMPWSWAD